VDVNLVPGKFDARLNFGYLRYSHNTTGDGVYYNGYLTVGVALHTKRHRDDQEHELVASDISAFEPVDGAKTHFSLGVG